MILWKINTLVFNKYILGIYRHTHMLGMINGIKFKITQLRRDKGVHGQLMKQDWQRVDHF